MKNSALLYHLVLLSCCLGLWACEKPKQDTTDTDPAFYEQVRLADSCFITKDYASAELNYRIASKLIASVSHGAVWCQSRLDSCYQQASKEWQENFSEISYSEGLYKVKGKSGKYGFVNLNGIITIPVEYDYVETFGLGLACVERKKKSGFIDREGNFVIPMIYDSMSEEYLTNSQYSTNEYPFIFASTLHGDWVKVKKNGKWGFLDKKGNIMLDFNYDEIRLLENGLIEVSKNDKIGIIDKNGNVIVPIIYDYISYFYEGLAKVEMNNRNGFINRKGKIVIPLIYDEINDFSEGMVAVKKDAKWGMIDTVGKEVIPFIYDRIYGSFNQGVIRVSKNKSEFYINKFGNTP